MSVSLTSLGYALLGLVRGEARSGYALRRVFETTPMGNYSSSPGSIYPALKILTDKGLIASRAAGAKSIFAITPAGLEALESWLAEPVTGDAISRHMDAVMLRFALLQDHANRDLTLAFIKSFETAAHSEIATLRAFMASGDWQRLPLHSRLAVDYGLRSLKTGAQWARDAYAQFTGSAE